MAFPIRVTQFAAQNLARRVARQRLDKIHRFRQFVPGNAFTCESDNLFRVKRRPGFRHDAGLDRLAPFFIRHADNGDIGNLRMREKRVLNFRRIDIFTARNNHVFDAVMDEDIALIIEEAGIAGIKPAVTHRIRRRFGFGPIALHIGFGAHDYFADLALRNILAVLIDNAYLDAGIGLAAATQFAARRVMVFGLQIGAATGGFGKAVNLHEIAFEFLRRLHQQFLGNR